MGLKSGRRPKRAARSGSTADDRWTAADRSGPATLAAPQSLRLATLAGVARAVIACERCPRLRDHCLKIAAQRKRAFRDQPYWGKPVPAYGDPKAGLLVIGLAPAAHGGNRTGRIFTGDSSGNWLYGVLHKYGFSNQPDSTGRGDGLVLTGVYVTAAGHCAPPANKPTADELDACQPYLEAELRLLRSVRVVIALGRIGWERYLRASGWWDKLGPRERPPFGHGVETRLPDGTILITSYHPSRQNTNTGRLTTAMWDAIFRTARARVDRQGIPKQPRLQ